MKTVNQISAKKIRFSNSSNILNYARVTFFLLTTVICFPVQQVKSEETFLKCTGKFEINRGELIKPDWETSYLRINMEGLMSNIIDRGIKKDGRTINRRKYITIIHRDNKNRVQSIYKIHEILGTYKVEYPQSNRTLIGTCQKGKG